jgi:hypothetical protein
MLRQSFEFLINQNVFTFQLYVLAGLNYAIAATGINRYRRLYIGASLFNILLICSFALAKSPIANVCLIICLFYSLVRPFTINLFKLIAIPVTVVCLLFPMYWATGIGRTTEKNTLIMISERIFFGQWAALPYYFELFDDLRLPYSSVLPPYIKSHLYGVDKMEMLEQVPARYVMRAIIGDDAVDEGGPGVASSFFIGEAYALGGYPAVIAGCVLVVSELWLLSMAFLHFRKTVVSSYIYAFMIFKFCMGLVSGISAFVLSGFTIILFIIISYAMALQAQHGHHYSH